MDPRRTRRDFLAWLAAVPAVAGCSGAEQAASSSAPPGHEPPPPDTVPPADTVPSDGGAPVCRLTTKDATGPYYEPGAPVRARIAALEEPGVPLLVEGRLFGPDCRAPLAGYSIDVWQADAAGNYYAGATTNYRLRGRVVTDERGAYQFETILPGRYGDAAGIRPAHLHVRMLTPGGGVLLTTQVYFAGDPYLGQADYCTRQGTCDSADAARALLLEDASVSGRAGKRARFDAFMATT